VDPAYCAQCGQRADAGDHEACERAGLLDPPRYCPSCGRRMIVKVTPDRWTARCARHGQAGSVSR
jgi:DNA-directed RNA polymerase subunit RPC12/RpoP